MVEAVCSFTICAFRRELEVLKQGGLRQRKSRLKSSPVVGTTCCALMQPQLWGDAGAFPVVILDEATQVEFDTHDQNLQMAQHGMMCHSVTLVLCITAAFTCWSIQGWYCHITVSRLLHMAPQQAGSQDIIDGQPHRQ